MAFSYFAPAVKGLETLLADEPRALSADSVRATRGRGIRGAAGGGLSRVPVVSARQLRAIEFESFSRA
jgi:23S rRNA G2445 N2-methylase RlmL